MEVHMFAIIVCRQQFLHLYHDVIMNKKLNFVYNRAKHTFFKFPTWKCHDSST